MKTERVVTLYKQACRREQALEGRIVWRNGWPGPDATVRRFDTARRWRKRLGAVLTARRVNPWTANAVFT